MCYTLIKQKITTLPQGNNYTDHQILHTIQE